MPAAPCVVAAATRTFAPVSKTPDADEHREQTLEAARRLVVVTSAAATATETDAARAATTAHAALSSAPASMPTTKSPKPSGGDDGESGSGRDAPLP